MVKEVLPLSADNRRAILVLDQHEYDKRSYEGEMDIFRNREACVLLMEDLEANDLPLALRNILDFGLARSGAVLVQSPFELDSYEDIEDAQRKFALDKHLYFSNLCMLLGAKRVAVEQVTKRDKLNEMSAKAKGGVTVKGINGKVKGSVDTSDLEKLRSEMNLHDEFLGGDADVEAAETLLRDKHLLADSNMRSLLEMSRSKSNRLLSRKLMLNLSNESKRNLQVAGSLEVAALSGMAEGGVNGSYKTTARQDIEYNLTIEVVF